MRLVFPGGGNAATPEIDELSRAARELAWSPHVPDDDEVETFAERARGSGQPEPQEPRR